MQFRRRVVRFGGVEQVSYEAGAVHPGYGAMDVAVQVADDVHRRTRSSRGGGAFAGGG